MVKQLQGESKFVVEKKHLSDVILEEASRIGEEAGKELAKILVQERPNKKRSSGNASLKALVKTA